MTTQQTDGLVGRRAEDAKIERKSFFLEIKDEVKGQVEAVFSTFGVKDKDNDWTEPDAFDGNDEVLIGAWSHGTVYGERPVGKGMIRVTEKEARLDGAYFMDTFEGKEEFTTVKNVGKIQEWSYSFYVLETGEITEKLRQLGVGRVLKKVEVLEISPVMRGAGVRTRTVAAKAASPDAPDPAVEDPPAKSPEELANEQAALDRKAQDDERAAAELKASTRAAVEEFHRVQRTLKRLRLV